MTTTKKMHKKYITCVGALLTLAFLFMLDAPVPLPFIRGMPKGSWSTFAWSAVPVLLSLILMVTDKKRVVSFARSLTWSWPLGEAEPFQGAVYLLCLLLPKAARTSVIGDIEEEYQANCSRFGPKRANFLVWAEVIRSLWPLLKRASASLFKWGAFGWLLELLHRSAR